MQEKLLTIIKLLSIDDEIIAQMQQSLMEINFPDEALSIVEDLKNRIDTSTGPKQYKDTPYFYLFLSYCYVILNKTEDAINASTQAINRSRIGGMNLLEGVSLWFRGIMYDEEKQGPLCREDLMEALKLTKSIKEEYIRKYDYQSSDNYNILIERIEEDYSYAIEKKLELRKLPDLRQKPEQKNILTPDDDSPVTKRSLILENPTEQVSKNIIQNNKSTNRQHITIPVDVDAFHDTVVKYNPLDKSLYNELILYNKRLVPNLGQVSKSVFFIRGFPIYGGVSAGIDGVPHLSTPQIYATPTDENGEIIFGTEKFLPRFIGVPTNLKDNNYGWLKVIGESMNEATPIPINNSDYILFRNNNNLSECKNQIVVALLPESETQPPQLVIKRLRKSARFLLCSESSYTIDPTTGSNYKNIAITNDYQLVGNVIVVAKRIRI